jgi:hypothetical protein
MEPLGQNYPRVEGPSAKIQAILDFHSITYFLV